MLANLVFLIHAIRLYFYDDRLQAIKTFRYSIHYLGILFIIINRSLLVILSSFEENIYGKYYSAKIILN